ncbi:MAG: hypothetical protein ACI9ES_000795 [Oceanospirillaceae bacterium]|jgi:hypothetical protein
MATSSSHFLLVVNFTYDVLITRLRPSRLNSNLPLSTVNSKKPRMPNVANRVDSFVICLLMLITTILFLSKILTISLLIRNCMYIEHRTFNYFVKRTALWVMITSLRLARNVTMRL